MNTKLVTKPAKLHLVPVHFPQHHVRINFVSSISPPSLAGNRYILTVSDYFMKWVEAVPLEIKKVSSVAITLQKGIKLLHSNIMTGAFME